MTVLLCCTLHRQRTGEVQQGLQSAWSALCLRYLHLTFYSYFLASAVCLIPARIKKGFSEELLHTHKPSLTGPPATTAQNHQSGGVICVRKNTTSLDSNTSLTHWILLLEVLRFGVLVRLNHSINSRFDAHRLTRKQNRTFHKLLLSKHCDPLMFPLKAFPYESVYSIPASPVYPPHQ